MIPDIIVIAILAFTAVFVAAWVVSPKLRARIEAPKHLFLEDIRRYDRRDHD